MTKTLDQPRKLPARPRARILRAEEAQAWRDGYAFLEAAREEARQIREAARRAYAAEYAKGYEEGKACGDAEAARLVSETVSKVDHYLAGIRNEIVSLALDVVEKVLGEFDVSELVALAAEQALVEIRSAKYLRISVHPAALEAVRDRLGKQLAHARFGFSVEINGDDALAGDACIIATDVTVIEAGIGVQIEAIADSLTYVDETVA